MASIIDTIAVTIGSSTRESFQQLGAITIFLGRVIKAMPSAFLRYHLIIEQMMILGIKSIPIVILVAFFVGAVTVWQVKYLFSGAIPYTYLGTAVGKAVFTELGPVLTGLVITGRMGAKLAAELGTMRVTEQIDAMTCLSLNPHCYLLAPRMIAGAIMAPVLTIFSAFIAIISAQVISQFALGLYPDTFYYGLKMLFKVQDVVICLVKAFVFGNIIALCGCYYGYFAKGGAVGVGDATKKAVVAAMVLLLISNFVMFKLLS